MGRGELSGPDQARVAAAVAEAERHTGLELCVLVCKPGKETTRAQADATFRRLGLPERPAVLVLLLPGARKVEVVTSPAARARLSDDDCQVATEAMTDLFAQGDMAGGLEAGLAVIAYRAGAGQDAPGQAELPDIVISTP